MKVRIRNRVSLTPRDYQLLEELYQNVVLSFPQVWRKIFPGKAKATALNRLARLELKDFICRWKVPRLRAGKDRDEILVVFQITRRGLRALRQWRTDGVYRDFPVGLNGYSLMHDVLLVDVMDALRERFPGASVTNARLIEARDGERIVHPDAVLCLPGGTERWAVELELTAKTERRYREIVLRYRLDRTYTRVLYVLETPRVENKLARILGQKPGRPCAKPPTEKFLCVMLSELFPRPNGVRCMDQNASNQQPKGETAA